MEHDRQVKSCVEGSNCSILIGKVVVDDEYGWRRVILDI